MAGSGGSGMKAQPQFSIGDMLLLLAAGVWLICLAYRIF
jgi:hypothetical protein